MEKVVFGRQVSLGLRAKVAIPAASFIIASCSSMAQEVTSGPGGLSYIESTPGQLGPKGARMLLGPLRFANHDCNPNCQVYALILSSDYLYIIHVSQFFPIKNTHAYILVTLVDIKAGESITVKYTDTGYYADGCLCASCHPGSPPNAAIYKTNTNPVIQSTSSKRKARRKKRGGVREKIAQMMHAEA